MGQTSQQKQIEKALEAARKAFGDVLVEANVPLESIEDHMRQAQAVLFYFDNGGKGFQQKQCKWCNGTFAFSWDSAAIDYCSIPCMAKKLESIGMKWNPSKPYEERWGRTSPAVVPSEALQVLKELL